MNTQHSFEFDDLTLFNKGECEPRAVVLLLGWWGAKTKHLSKYAEIYRQKHCFTVQAIGDKIAVLAHDNSSLDDCICTAVQHMAKLLNAVENDIPVIVHAFSNGGAYLLERLEKLILKARETKANADLILVGERMKGQIFDSSPVYPSVEAATKAMVPVFPSKFMQMLIGTIFYINGALSLFFKFITGKKTYEEQFWEHMISTEMCKNQAYIYSTTDTITNVEHLECLIESREALSDSNVRRLKFEDSQHVQHLRTHPNDYDKMVSEMIEKASVFLKENTVN